MADTTATSNTTTKGIDETALTTSDPAVPIKVDAAQEYLPDEETKSQLPGARALTEVFDWLLDGAERISAALDSQENETVKQMLLEWLAVADGESQELASKFAELYPDEPPLAGTVTKTETGEKKPKGSTEGAEDDTEEPEPLEQDDRYKGLTAKERLAKRLAWRRGKKAEADKKRLEELTRLKRMTKAAQTAVGDAAEHLKDLTAEEHGLKGGMRNLCKYHSAELRKLMEGGAEWDASTDEAERKRIADEVEAKAQALADRIVKEQMDRMVKTFKATIDILTKAAEKARAELARAKQGR